MILICPSCETRYTLSDDAVGENGRTVRCRACGHSWFAKPAHVLEAESEVKDESGLTRAQVERLRQKAQSNSEGRTGPHAEIREKEKKRRKRNRMLAAGAAWSVGAVLFCSAATASMVYREKIVDIWPKTASLYAFAGMEVNRFGLEFSSLEARRSFDGTTPILTIDGGAVNVSDSHRATPNVRIQLISETGDIVHEERVGLIDEVIAPGAATGFSAHIVSPPMDSYRLSVDFEDQPKRGGHADEYAGGAHQSGHEEDHAPDHGADLNDDQGAAQSHPDAAHGDESHAVDIDSGDSHAETAHDPTDTDGDADHADDHGAAEDDGHH